MSDRQHIIDSPSALEAGRGSPPRTTYGTAPDLPPAYEDCPADRREPPPSYESLYGQLRSVQRESSGICDFLLRLFKILLSTIACTVAVGIIVAIPLSMIIVGAVYFHECPREHYIPIYLVVGGSFGLCKNLIDLIRRIKNRREGNEEENSKTNPLDSVVGCFLTGWFIAGSVWIYRIYTDFDKELNPVQPERYCYGPLYYYAFWLTTIVYVFMGLFGLCFICCGCLALFLRSESNGSD